MISLFIILGLSSTERAVPTWWLNNWDKKNPLIAFWASAQDSWTVPPSHHPGIQEVRAFDNLTTSILSDDTFALSIDDVIYGNPMLLNSSHLGGCVQEVTGEFWTEYTHYNRTLLPIKVRRSFYLPPYENYYLIKYTVESTDNNDHEVGLLDYFRTAQQTTGFCLNDICRMIEENAGSVSTTIFRDQKDRVTSEYTLGEGSYQNNGNVLTHFAENGKFSRKYGVYRGDNISFGALYSFLLQPNEPIEITVIRAFGRNGHESHLTAEQARKESTESIIQKTSERIMQWIQSGNVPNTIKGDALDLYYKSLLVLKNAQNPVVGTISSSFHVLYGYKNWMRDALMSAFMLDAAGHHDEFRLFMDWAAEYATLDDKGGFHTTYSSIDGSFVGFVEPQYDANGLYLMAMNYHLQCFGDNEWVKSKIPQLEKFAELLMKRSYKYNLAPDDRSPWEESSDHHTGLPVPTYYTPWMMGNSYGGLVALSKIERQNGDISKSEDYLNRANEIKEATLKYLWDDSNQRFYRGRNSETFEIDEKAESATLSVIFTGLVKGDEARSHLKYIVSKLTHLEYGLARYTGDPFFHDSRWNPCGNGKIETQKNEPAWPVVTAYAAWSEDALGIDYSNRLNWMVRYSAYGNMPTGECVDSKDGALVVPSAPDCFEHGGVYVFTTLLHEKQAKSILDTLQ